MPWTTIVCAVAKEAGKLNRLDANYTVDKSRFNRTGFPFDKESRRDAQFKFFGYKPKRFISIYARKPRVRVKVKEEYKVKIDLDKWRRESALYEAEMDYRRNAEAYRQQTLLGMQNSSMVFNRMAAAQSQQFANIAAQSNINIQGDAHGNALGLGGYSGASDAIGLGSAFATGRII